MDRLPAPRRRSTASHGSSALSRLSSQSQSPSTFARRPSYPGWLGQGLRPCTDTHGRTFKAAAAGAPTAVRVIVSQLALDVTREVRPMLSGHASGRTVL